MESSPNLTVVQRVSWQFTPRLLGAPSQTIYMQLYNPGYLPTEFLMKFPTDRDFEPEPWVDEGEFEIAYLVDRAHVPNELMSMYHKMPFFQAPLLFRS